MKLGTDKHIKTTLGYIGNSSTEMAYLTAVIVQLLGRVSDLEAVNKQLEEEYSKGFGTTE